MIGPDSEQLGIVGIRRALDLAQEHDLDLVEIAPTGKPPVCRIMDWLVAFLFTMTDIRQKTLLWQRLLCVCH